MWNAGLEAHYRAELVDNTDGTVRVATSANAIAAATDQVLKEPWAELVARVPHPVLVLNAVEEYGPPGVGALVPEENAREMAAAFREGRYVQVPGNHLTMVFGDHAHMVAGAIATFAVDRGER
jgi:hypothetical protein